jgi:hypothetical protein
MSGARPTRGRGCPASIRLRFDEFDATGAMIVMDDESRVRFRFEV